MFVCFKLCPRLHSTKASPSKYSVKNTITLTSGNYIKILLESACFSEESPNQAKSSKFLSHIPLQVKHFSEATLQAVIMTFYRPVTPNLCSPSPALVGGKHHAHTSITQSKHCSVALNLDSEYKQAWDSSGPPTPSTTCYSHQLKALAEKHHNVLERAQLAVELTPLFSTQTTVLKLRIS